MHQLLFSILSVLHFALFRLVGPSMFIRYRHGGVGYVGVGTKITVVFVDEDFEWQDVEPKVQGHPDRNDNDDAVVLSWEKDGPISVVATLTQEDDLVLSLANTSGRIGW